MRIASIAAAASSIGMLFAHSAGAARAGEGDSEALEQVVVTGTRVANRSALETAAPVDVVLGDQLQNLGVTRDQPGAGREPAVLQLSAARPHRRHRCGASGDVARPRARPDAWCSSTASACTLRRSST